jgi:hypothetical protein
MLEICRLHNNDPVDKVEEYSPDVVAIVEPYLAPWRELEEATRVAGEVLATIKQLGEVVLKVAEKQGNGEGQGQIASVEFGAAA